MYRLRNNTKYPIILGIPEDDIQEKTVRRLVRDEEGRETTAVETIETIVQKSIKHHLPETLRGQDPGTLDLSDEQWERLTSQHPMVKDWATRRSEGGLGWIDVARISIDSEK